MMMLSGWHVERRAPLSDCVDPPPEVIRWQDSASSLSVSQVGAPEDGIYRLRLDSDLVVDVMPDHRIVTRENALFPQKTIDHFLADQVFPRLLAHVGTFVVHAGAVRIDKAALMLMGNSGRGKSTLVASFDRAGFALLGDDAMIVSSLDATPRVRPVYPSLRLFPDSIEALMPGAVTAGPMAHYSTKNRVDVKVAPTPDNMLLPIRALFSIARPAEDGLVAVRRLTLAETCMSLVESSFSLDPSDIARARDRMEQASALASRVPAFEISYPRDYSRLPEVRQAILDQVAALEPA